MILMLIAAVAPLGRIRAFIGGKLTSSFCWVPFQAFPSIILVIAIVSIWASVSANPHRYLPDSLTAI